MNYIKELNAFYNQIIFDPLSGAAVSLWNTLMHMNNACGWRKEFTAPASILELKSGIKGTSFKRAREELRTKGYIRVKSRGGNQAPIYQIISQWNETQQEGQAAPSFFVPSQQQEQDTSHEHPHQQTTNHPVNQKPGTTTDGEKVHTTDQQMDGNTDHSLIHHTDHHEDHNPSGNSANSPAPLYKQKEKSKQTIRNVTMTTSTEAIRFYQENFGTLNAFVAGNIEKRINDNGEPLVLHAMERALEQNKPTWRYVKAILNRWNENDIATVAQANQEDAAYRSQKRQASDKHKKSSQDVVPKWFRDRKQKQAQAKSTTKSTKQEPVEEPWDEEAFARDLALLRGQPVK